MAAQQAGHTFEQQLWINAEAEILIASLHPHSESHQASAC
jgi:hypothetical protein